MKGPIFWGMVAVVILSATAILVSAKHEEYNRYELSAGTGTTSSVWAYKLDKRTGQVWLLSSVKQMNVNQESAADESARELRRLAYEAGVNRN